MRPVLALCVAVLLLVACGSSDDDPGAVATVDTNAVLGPFSLTSSAFEDGAPIPAKYTCQGDNVSPELIWTNVPDGTASLALLMVDPDAPVDGGFTHWVLTGLDPLASTLPEGSSDGDPGETTSGNTGYTGPCPPSGVHHYVFTLYALPEPIAGEPTREAIEEAAKSALGSATLTGTYEQS